MKLLLNGQPQVVDGPISIADLLDRLGQTPRAVAVAVNECFVPRAEHAQRLLAHGDRVTCIQPIVGG